VGKRPDAWRDLANVTAARDFLGDRAEVLAWRVRHILDDVEATPAQVAATGRQIDEEIRAEIESETGGLSPAMNAILLKRRESERVRDQTREKINRLHLVASQTAKRLLGELAKLVEVVGPLDRQANDAARLARSARMSRLSSRRSAPSSVVIASGDRSPELEALEWFSHRIALGVPFRTPSVEEFALLCKALEQLRETAPAPKPRTARPRRTKWSLDMALSVHLAAMQVNNEPTPRPKELAAAEVVARGRGFPRASQAQAACARWEKALGKAQHHKGAWLEDSAFFRSTRPGGVSEE
jgi:hypothetical protein